MPDSTAAVNELCVRLSKDALLVQGAGGNVSWKSSGVLWIKASGTWLEEAESKEIFIPISLNEIAIHVRHGNYGTTPTPTNESDLKPSIETWLHALMPQKFVVHLHALDILALLIRPDAEKLIDELLGQDANWGFVKYVKPGPDLALAVAALAERQPDLQVLFLENHGIVIGSETIEEFDAILSRLRRKLGVQRQHEMVKGLAPEESLVGEYQVVDDLDVQLLAQSAVLYPLLQDAWAVSPDQVVFLGDKPSLFESVLALKALSPSGAPNPALAFVKGVGVYSLGKVDRAGVAQLKCYFELLVRQPTGQKLNVFDEKQISELLNWDAEKYRQQLRK